jgi:hypothetical protein
MDHVSDQRCDICFQALCFRFEVAVRLLGHLDGAQVVEGKAHRRLPPFSSSNVARGSDPLLIWWTTGIQYGGIRRRPRLTLVTVVALTLRASWSCLAIPRLASSHWANLVMAVILLFSKQVVCRVGKILFVGCNHG